MKGTCFMFKKNEGSTDRVIRVVIGLVALITGLFFLTGTMQVVSLIVGVIALITGAIGFCGLYALVGISTCPIKK